MPLYKVMRRNGATGYLECSIGGKVSRATESFKWSIGKAFTSTSEWLHAHQMHLERLSTEVEMAPAKVALQAEMAND